jgi:hypothetical protein
MEALPRRHCPLAFFTRILSAKDAVRCDRAGLSHVTTVDYPCLDTATGALSQLGWFPAIRAVAAITFHHVCVPL